MPRALLAVMCAAVIGLSMTSDCHADQRASGRDSGNSSSTQDWNFGNEYYRSVDDLSYRYPPAKKQAQVHAKQRHDVKSTLRWSHYFQLDVF